jgi:nicotinate-nucleotide adenylyltransferase
MSKKRIGIYGGAFDPLHNGHIKPIDQVFREHDLDRIHFIPTNISNSEKKIFASHVDRLEMLSIGLNNSAYIADDREIIRKGISYTIDTIESVIEEYKGVNIYLIIGSDILPTLNKWKDFNNIMLLCNIIVLARMTKNNDSLIDKELKPLICSDLAIFHGNSYGKIYIQDAPLINISSTEIRSRLQKNQKVSNLIPLRLDQWLQKRKIY